MESYGGNPRYNHYDTKDGKAVAISLLESKLWREFCDIIGRPDLVHVDEPLLFFLDQVLDRLRVARVAELQTLRVMPPTTLVTERLELRRTGARRHVEPQVSSSGCGNISMRNSAMCNREKNAIAFCLPRCCRIMLS